MEQHTYNQILRKTLGITEVPLFEEEFEKWMKSRWHSSGSIQSYISWIRTLDRQVFLPGRDLMVAIDLLFSKGAYNLLPSILEGAEKDVEKAIQQKKEKKDYVGKRNLANCLSALRAYKNFIMDKASSTVSAMDGTTDEETFVKEDSSVEDSPSKCQSCEPIPMENEFYDFLKKKKGFVIGTVKSYISYIKSCDKRFLSNVVNKGFSQLIKDSQNPQMELNWILQIIDNKKTSLAMRGIPSATIDNWKSALKAYQEFLGTKDGFYF